MPTRQQDPVDEMPAPLAKKEKPKRSVLPHLYVWDPNLRHEEGRRKSSNLHDRNYDPDDKPHWFRRATPDEVKQGAELMALRNAPAGQLTESQLQTLLAYKKLEEKAEKEEQEDDLNP